MAILLHTSINFEVRFWHGAEILEMWRARDLAAQAIKRALDREAITIPFPQSTVRFGPGNTELRTRALDARPGTDPNLDLGG